MAVVPSPSLVAPLRRLPTVAGGLVVLAGCLVLIGWQLDIESLKHIGPDLVAMNPVTAVAFILAGIALLLWPRPGAQANLIRRRLILLCGLAVALIGLLRLGSYLFGWPLTVDQLLFEGKLGPTGTGPANRMAPNTAWNFLLSGGALVLLDGHRRRNQVAQALALTVALVALLALIGYGFGAREFYGIATYIPMALHTAATFLVLSAGSLCVQPDQGLMATFVSDSPGGQLARRLLPAAIVIPFLLGWLQLQGERRALYSTAFGVALLAVASILVFSFVIWLTASSLHRSDVMRRRAELSLARRTAELEEATNSLEAVIENIPVMLYMKDAAEMWFVRWNRASEEIAGLPSSAVLGKHDYDIFPAADADRWVAQDRDVLARGRLVDIPEEPLPTAHRGVRLLHTRKLPILGADGRPKYLLSVSDDITERKEMDDRLRRAHDELDMRVRQRTTELAQANAGLRVEIAERQRAEVRIQRQLDQLAALRTIDRAISSNLDMTQTLKVFLDQVITQLGVHAADVLLFNPATQLLEYAAGRGFHADEPHSVSQRVGEGRAGQVALERRMLVISDRPAAHPPAKRTRLLGGEGFVSYFGVPLVAKGQVLGVLEIFHRGPLDPEPSWLSFLEALAGQAAIAIENAALFDGLQRAHAELVLAYDATIEGWSRALDLRDKETEGHSQRVTEVALRLARKLGLAEADLVHFRRGALLHDIGKMGVPDRILLKPGPLTEDEWVVMRRHPTHAYELLSPIRYLRPALHIPYCHHEKWDGSGYPRGLTGEQIPLEARIFAVVDAWDALRSHRPYRPAWPEAQVRLYLQAQAGQHFDPQAVDAFLELNVADIERPTAPGEP